MPEPEFFVTKLPRATPGRGGKRHSDKLGRPKVHPVVDMTGQKIGAWTFLCCLTPGKGMTETRYIMQCDCGHIQKMQVLGILGGDSESCEKNCGRGKQLREHGWLEPGQTPGSRLKNLGRAKKSDGSLQDFAGCEPSASERARQTCLDCEDKTDKSVY